MRGQCIIWCASVCPSFCRYQVILLGDIWVWTTCPRLLLDSAAAGNRTRGHWVTAPMPCHYAIKPQSQNILLWRLGPLQLGLVLAIEKVTEDCWSGCDSFKWLKLAGGLFLVHSIQYMSWYTCSCHLWLFSMQNDEPIGYRCVLLCQMSRRHPIKYQSLYNCTSLQACMYLVTSL